MSICSEHQTPDPNCERCQVPVSWLTKTLEEIHAKIPDEVWEKMPKSETQVIQLLTGQVHELRDLLEEVANHLAMSFNKTDQDYAEIIRDKLNK